MYDFRFSRYFEKDLRALSDEAVRNILNVIIPQVVGEPGAFPVLKGKRFKGMRKVAFRFKRVDYRIVYELKKKEVRVLFLAVGSRENFYDKLLRRF